MTPEERQAAAVERLVREAKAFMPEPGSPEEAEMYDKLAALGLRPHHLRKKR